jgi:putative membrane protein
VTDLFEWEWEWQLPLIATLVIAELGFMAIWARRKSRGGGEHRSWSALALFTAGLLVFALAVMSPIGANDERLLSMHMIEHDLLMWGAAPLLVLGSLELVADGRWLPGALRRSIAILTRPIVAFTISTVLLWGWHAPPAYGLALTSLPVHGIEHLSFLAAYIIYWWPLAAAPSMLGGLQSNAGRVGYLLAGAIVSGLLGALLTFATSMWYPHYALVPGASVESALADQRLAGAIMWYPGAIIFALAAALTLRAPAEEPLAIAG